MNNHYYWWGILSLQSPSGESDTRCRIIHILLSTTITSEIMAHVLAEISYFSYIVWYVFTSWCHNNSYFVQNCFRTSYCYVLWPILKWNKWTFPWNVSFIGDASWTRKVHMILSHTNGSLCQTLFRNIDIL